MGGRMERCVWSDTRESRQPWEFAKGSFSLLQWLIQLKWGWELHPSTSEAQLPITLQTGLEQDVTCEPHSTQHLHSHCASSAEDSPGARHSAHTLPFRNQASSPPQQASSLSTHHTCCSR